MHCCTSRLQRIAISLLLFAPIISAAGCGYLSGDTKVGEGIVISPVLKIRSSTATVALDLAELKRGDRVDILDHSEVRTPTKIDEWYKIKTKTKDPVTGWVQANYIINQATVDKVESIYQKSKALPNQGNGRLKVSTKLRIEPGGDVATVLSRGMEVDIVGKARTTVKTEKQPSSDDSDDDSDEPEERTILWYQVRLPDTEVLRAGWVGAQQVELDVPEDIMYLEGEGRRFTGWVVFDQTKDSKGTLHPDYIGLMKSLNTEGPIDFTRLWILIYAPDEGRYTGPYIKDGLRGVLPVTLNTTSGRKGFTIHELGADGKPYSVEYETIRHDASHWTIAPITSEVPTKKKGK
ncbi:MAG TPA: SH3 domain-containing protein [Blastocatellia bacterium]|nr:SH3 domain-containing protein [Blastocatellia bacterium]